MVDCYFDFTSAVSKSAATVEAVNLVGLDELHTACAIECHLCEFRILLDGEGHIIVFDDYIHLALVAWIYLADYHIAVETIVAFASAIDGEETKEELPPPFLADTLDPFP